MNVDLLSPRPNAMRQLIDGLGYIKGNFPRLDRIVSEELLEVSEEEKHCAASFGLQGLATEQRADLTRIFCIHHNTGKAATVNFIPNFEKWAEQYIAKKHMATLDGPQLMLLKVCHERMLQRQARETNFLHDQSQNPYFTNVQNYRYAAEQQHPDKLKKSALVTDYYTPGVTLANFEEEIRATAPSQKDTNAYVSAVGIQVAYALAQAHAKGKAYVDIRPDVIAVHPPKQGGGFVTFTEALRVADLDPTKNIPNIVQVGSAFCPPEFAAQLLADPKAELQPSVATEIYMLGCLLFTLRTHGQVPYPFRKEADVLNAHVEHSVPRGVLEQAHNERGPIVDIICRCLAKDPKDRPASMSEVAAELRNILGDHPLSEIIGPAGKAPEAQIPDYQFAEQVADQLKS